MGLTLVTVQRWCCEHCRRSWSQGQRKAADRHVSACWYDPGNHGCKTCEHFRPDEPSDGTPGDMGSAEHCDLGISLENARGLRNILGEISTEPKVHCEHWSADE